MNDTQLRLFLSVADHGSFSSAEDSQFISKQAILRQINSLEAEVGVPLFLRTSAGVALTPAGKEFYQGAKKLLKLQDQVVNACRGAVPAPEVIRIGQVEHQALLHRVTDAFVLKYPDIQIQKVIHPNHSGEYRVSNHITDVGETFYRGDVVSQAYSYTKLADMPYLAAMRHGHPLCKYKTLSLAHLTAYPTVVFDLMVKKEYLAELRRVYGELDRTENLLVRSDVDNQVDVAFQCSTSDQLFLTANPFITEIPQLATRRLGIGWSQEYGIIYRPNPTSAVQKYIDLAVSLFKQGR